jgi:hypothetical protein
VVADGRKSLFYGPDVDSIELAENIPMRRWLAHKTLIDSC